MQPVSHVPSPQKPDRSGTLLLVIGAFKLVKAVLLVIVSLGALKLVHHDIAEQVEGWLRELRLDPGNHLFYAAIQKLDLLDDRKLKEISAGSMFYAVLFIVEGVGLCRRKRWAEYLTSIITASLLPIEAYEVYRRLTAPRVLLLLVNVAVVVYLVRRLIKERPGAATPDGTSKPS